MNRIAPQTGVAFPLDRGATLRIVDPTGAQVCDLFCVTRADVRETLSGGRSIDYADKLYLTTGDVLYSNRSTPLLTIVHDDVGRHDLTLTPCSPEMFVKLRGDDGTHPSCFENLRVPLARYGVQRDTITCSFNIFMDVRFDADTGRMLLGAPPGRAGDAIVLRAEVDLYVGLTACSSEVTNAGRCKPIDYRVYEGGPASE
ncbi:MAG: urea carboxylase-associated family protein [Deltaproteobacteria bacterium]|nr:urea carboxylase-associated family protein [Deltaproteobacteria bacterium]